MIRSLPLAAKLLQPAPAPDARSHLWPAICHLLSLQLPVEQCLNQSTEVMEVKNKPFTGGGEGELFLIVIISIVFLPVWSHKEFH